AQWLRAVVAICLVGAALNHARDIWRKVASHVRNAEGVSQHSPGSRSAPWEEGNSIFHFNREAVPQSVIARTTPPGTSWKLLSSNLCRVAIRCHRIAVLMD